MTHKSHYLRISNMNCMNDSYLSRSLAAFRKEHVFNMATLECEREELKKFMKKIYVCDSEREPAHIKYIQTGFIASRGNTPARKVRRPDPAIVAAQLQNQTGEDNNQSPAAAIEENSSSVKRQSVVDITQPATESVALQNSPIQVLVNGRPRRVERGNTMGTMPPIMEACLTSPSPPPQTVVINAIDSLHVPTEVRKPPTRMRRTKVRCRSRSKIEMDRLQRMKREQKRRERVKQFDIDNKVRLFCDKLDNLKIEMSMQGMITSMC